MTNNGENVDDNIIWSNLLTSGTKGIIKNMVNNTPATTSLIKKTKVRHLSMIWIQYNMLLISCVFIVL